MAIRRRWRDPAGPMREPLEVGIARASAVAVILPIDVAEVDPELRALFGELDVWTARWQAVGPPAGRRLGLCRCRQTVARRAHPARRGV